MKRTVLSTAILIALSGTALATPPGTPPPSTGVFSSTGAAINFENCNTIGTSASAATQPGVGPGSSTTFVQGGSYAGASAGVGLNKAPTAGAGQTSVAGAAGVITGASESQTWGETKNTTTGHGASSKGEYFGKASANAGSSYDYKYFDGATHMDLAQAGHADSKSQTDTQSKANEISKVGSDSWNGYQGSGFVQTAITSVPVVTGHDIKGGDIITQVPVQTLSGNVQDYKYGGSTAWNEGNAPGKTSTSGNVAVSGIGHADFGKVTPPTDCKSAGTCDGGNGHPTDPKDPKDHGNNGWGNGDQDAPGNSGSHNNAENHH